MQNSKYIRFKSGEIISVNNFDDSIYECDFNHSDNILNLFEVNDLVKIKYLNIEELFIVTNINDNIIKMQNRFNCFIIKDNEFINKEINPIITAIIPKERIKSIEYPLEEKYTLSSTLKDMMSGLMDLYKRAYEELNPKVDYIIENKVTDLDYIAKILDRLLNIPHDYCYLLFIKLCNYIAKFNKPFADEYITIYQELYGEDEPKIKKKIK